MDRHPEYGDETILTSFIVAASVREYGENYSAGSRNIRLIHSGLLRWTQWFDKRR